MITDSKNPTDQYGHWLDLIDNRHGIGIFYCKTCKKEYIGKAIGRNPVKTSQDLEKYLSRARDDKKAGHSADDYWEGAAAGALVALNTNPTPEKGQPVVVDHKHMYFAGRTLYPSKARLLKAENRDRGIETILKPTRSGGTFIYTSQKTYPDLSESIWNPIDSDMIRIAKETWQYIGGDVAQSMTGNSEEVVGYRAARDSVGDFFGSGQPNKRELEKKWWELTPKQRENILKEAFPKDGHFNPTALMPSIHRQFHKETDLTDSQILHLVVDNDIDLRKSYTILSQSKRDFMNILASKASFSGGGSAFFAYLKRLLPEKHMTIITKPKGYNIGERVHYTDLAGREYDGKVIGFTPDGNFKIKKKHGGKSYHIVPKSHIISKRNPFLPDLGAAATLGGGWALGSTVAAAILGRIFKKKVAKNPVEYTPGWNDLVKRTFKIKKVK